MKRHIRGTITLAIDIAIWSFLAIFSVLMVGCVVVAVLAN